jgi:putative ABC transport system ATP-binding protein
MDEKAKVLQTKAVAYTYPSAEKLTFPDLSCEQGEHMLISGDSGAGKSTLLHLLGGLRRVMEGQIWIAGSEISQFSNRERDSFRGRHIGFVFQQPSFIQSLSVLENILAAQFFGRGKANMDKAIKLLEELGIARYKNKKTNELSGGERQRLSIARALSISPMLVLADEPTSSLDDSNAFKVHELLVKEAELNGATLVVVTHDSRLKAEFQNRVDL